MSYCFNFVFDPGIANSQEDIVQKFCHEGFEVLPCNSEYLSRIKDLRHPQYNFEISVFPDRSVNSWISAMVKPDDMEIMLKEMLLLSEMVGCELYVDELRITSVTITIARQKYVDYWAEYHYFFDFLDDPEFKKRSLAADMEALGIEELQEPEHSLLDLTIDDLHLSVRPASCLKKADITLVGELIQKTAEELRMIPGMRRWSIAHIRKVLAEKGLSLGMNVKNWPPKRMIN